MMLTASSSNLVFALGAGRPRSLGNRPAGENYIDAGVRVQGQVEGGTIVVLVLVVVLVLELRAVPGPRTRTRTAR
jgi:hypothetical protein